MEYTDIEKQVLSLMQRTDFKNLSKTDVVSIFSQLSQLRPEVAKEVLSQFPEFVNLLQTSMIEYRDVLDKIISSDDESLKTFYEIAENDLDSAAESRREFYDFADKVLADISKCLDKPDLTKEERSEMLDREMDILKAVGEKDSEIREHEADTVRMVDKKDSEKRQFNWRAIGAASATVALVVGICSSILGGKVDLSLPQDLLKH